MLHLALAFLAGLVLAGGVAVILLAKVLEGVRAVALIAAALIGSAVTLVVAYVGFMIAVYRVATRP